MYLPLHSVLYGTCKFAPSHLLLQVESFWRGSGAAGPQHLLLACCFALDARCDPLAGCAGKSVYTFTDLSQALVIKFMQAHQLERAVKAQMAYAELELSPPVVMLRLGLDSRIALRFQHDPFRPSQARVLCNITWRIGIEGA